MNFSGYQSQNENSAQVHATAMVEKLRAIMLESAGLKSAVVDGQAVTFADLEALLEHWEAQSARLARHPRRLKPRVSAFRMNRGV